MYADTLISMPEDVIDLTDTCERPRAGSGEPLDVLIAEDDRHDQLLLTLACADARPSIRLAFVENGAQLLAVLRRRVDEGNGPDVVLLDLRMPRMDGHTALEEMQRNKSLSDIPVIALSSSTARDDVLRCYASGVLAYETKPSNFGELVGLFDRLPRMLST